MILLGGCLQESYMVQGVGGASEGRATQVNVRTVRHGSAPQLVTTTRPAASSWSTFFLSILLKRARRAPREMPSSATA
jgi:hypothetical protein